MARPKLDITGTAAEAEARGVSRRTIQRERARLALQAEAAVEQARPVQLTLDGFEPAKLPEIDELRVDPIESANKLGWLERAAQFRLREAMTRGDAAAVKLFASSLADIWKIITRVEPMADLRVAQLKSRKSERAEIEGNLDEILALHGPAYVRAHMPSPSEVDENFTTPMTDEELERWNEYWRKRNRRDAAAEKKRQADEAAERQRLADAYAQHLAVWDSKT